MPNKDSLLIAIQAALGCPYLSDLHEGYHLPNKQAMALLMEIPLDQYPLSEWNRAASYMTGTECCFASPEEARNKIINSK